jgi:APA family basic amino acid/polyamine antiporter
MPCHRRGPAGARVPLAIAAIVVLSIFNYVGSSPAAACCNVLVVLKGRGAVLLIGAGFCPAAPPAGGPTRVSRPARVVDTRAFGAALVPILFSLRRLQSANYVGEEIADPKRNLPRALIAGTLASCDLRHVNVVYLRALGIEGLAD